MRKRVDSYELEDVVKFNLEDLREAIQKDAPLLQRLLSNLFRPLQARAGTSLSTYKKNSGMGGMEKSKSEAEGWFSEGEDGEENNGEENNTGTGLKPPAGYNSAKVAEDRLSRMLPMALSILCYMHTNQSNLLQGKLGYIFGASGVGKRELAALNRLGVVLSYTSILRLQTRIGRLAENETKRRAYENHFDPTFDNVNKAVNHKNHMIHKKGHLSHQTTGYLRFYPHPQPIDTDGRPIPDLPPVPLNKSDINRSAVEDLSIDDVVPDIEYWERTSIALMLQYLQKRIPKTIAKLIKGNRLDPEFLNIQPIHEVPLEPSVVSNLPLIDKNEAMVTEVIDILKAVIEETGTDRRALINRVVLWHGDWLT